MKIIFKTAITLILITIVSTSIKAQVGFSAGLELGTSLDDGYGLGFGFTGGIEAPVSSNGGITGRIGYIKLTVDDGIFNNGSAYMVPIQGGYKYYFDSNESGFYLHGQLGLTLFGISYEFETIDSFNLTTGKITYKTEKVSDNGTYLSYAIGGGCLINENFDLGLRYNIVNGDGGNLDYLGVRLGYNF